MKCKYCGQEMKSKESNWIKIKGLGEVERALHTDMNKLSLIKIPEGMDILTLSELLDLWNNHREKFDWGGDLFDEVIQQPIKENKKRHPFYNLWLSRLDDESGLYGLSRNLIVVDRVRGVRFVRRKK